MARGFWLFKSDPDTFSWSDLVRSPGRRTAWDGVRNYEARNALRDAVREGDGVLFYHSQSEKAVVGTARVARGGYPDPTQFDKRHPGHDGAAARDDPRWYAVDIVADDAFAAPVALDTMRRTPGLSSMVLLRRGSRLSVQPVTAQQWRIVVRLGRAG